MTTMFEGSVPQTTMFDHLEDTEMAVDASKMAPAVEDIDIDLDFTDYSHQDEMMVEDDQEPAYDMVLGDAVATMEQDEVMTDENPEDEILDEEIIDAPLEVVEAAEVEDIPDAGFESVSQADLDASLTGIPQQDNLTIDNTGTEGQATEVQLEPELLSANIDTDGYIAVNDNESVPKPKADVEVEELITWESDEEEEEEEDNSKHTKVGDTAVAAQAKEAIVPPIVEVDELQKSETLEYNPATVAQSTEEAPKSDNRAGTDPQEPLDTTINHEEESHHIAERTVDDNSHDTVAENEHDSTADAPALPEPDLQNDQHNSYTSDATIKEQALEQLHPINIRYMDEAMSLFPPTLEEEHTVFFLSEKKLAFESCENLFKAFRGVLSESITEEESLVLSCPDLGLDIHEGIPETSTLSIAQLLHLHLGLSHNDGHDQPSPMLLVLKHHHDVSARLNYLYAMLSNGKGVSALSGGPSSEQTHNDEHVAEEEDFGDEEFENDEQSTAEVQETRLSANESHEVQDGSTTPARESKLEANNDELDFQSPVAASKSHKQMNLGEADATDATTATIEDEDDNAAIGHTEITSVQKVIDYDDNEGVAPEGSLTGDVHDGNQELSLPAVDLIQQATNLETHHELSVTKDTDHSDLENGSAPIVDGKLAEDTFDLDDPIVEPDTSDMALAAEEGDVESSTHTIENANGAHQIRETSSTSTVPTVVEEFEEIGYSDDEEEPLPEPTKQVSEILHSPGHRSPKRSNEDLDESDRDVKKLRSG